VRSAHALGTRCDAAWGFKKLKTLEREAMLKRMRELDAEMAQHERNLREGEARLLIEEQLNLRLRRFLEASVPELAGKVSITIRHK
jgi:hypothetical protein